MSISKDLVKFISVTQSRDKIFRTVQYGSRLILWQLTYGSTEIKTEVVVRLRKLEAALGLSRKLFRIGNSVDLAHRAWDALGEPLSLMMMLNFTSLITKTLWLVIDHFLWFAKVGLVKIDQQFWTKCSLRAWLVALTSATVSDYMKVQLVQYKLEKYRKKEGYEAMLPADLQKEMRAVRLNFWRDFCDMFIPLGGLSYTSPGVAALCGVVSSVIGFQQEWEKHIRPFRPSV